MLILKSDVTQNEAGTELYIEVVNATGVYNAIDNVGGFGAPNALRNEVALIFYGNHKKSAADVEAVPATHDPLSVESFTLPLSESVNGHLEYYVFAVEIFAALGVYADGDIVYDNEDPSEPFLKKKVAGVWVQITAADIVGEAGVVASLADNAFPVPDAAAFINALNRARVIKLREFVAGTCQEETYKQLRIWYDYADGELDVATKDFCALAYAEAQIKLEAVLTFKATIDGQY